MLAQWTWHEFGFGNEPFHELLRIFSTVLEDIFVICGFWAPQVKYLPHLSQPSVIVNLPSSRFTSTARYCILTGDLSELQPTNRNQVHNNKKNFADHVKFIVFIHKTLYTKSAFLIIRYMQNITLRNEKKKKTGTDSMKSKVHRIRFEESCLLNMLTSRTGDHSFQFLWAVSSLSNICYSNHVQKHWPIRYELCLTNRWHRHEWDLPLLSPHQPYRWSSQPTNSMCQCTQHYRSPCTCYDWRGRMGCSLDPRWLERWNVSKRTKQSGF